MGVVTAGVCGGEGDGEPEILEAGELEGVVFANGISSPELLSSS